MMSREDLLEKLGLNVLAEDFTELRFIINTAKRKLGINNDYTFSNPRQPLLINILNMTERGCSVYYRMLRKRSSSHVSQTTRENRWHEELQIVCSSTFWTWVYKLQASIRKENRVKWLQYQINRNSLYTNHRVSKFHTNVSPYCTFCTLSGETTNVELVSHLFYSCKVVSGFWQELRTWALGINSSLTLQMDIKIILFGFINQPFDSIPNFLILMGKHFIWKSKQRLSNPSFRAFKSFLKNKLIEIKSALELEKKVYLFDKWLVIFDYL